MAVTDPGILSALFPATLLLLWPARRFFGEKGTRAVLLSAAPVFLYLTQGLAGVWILAVMLLTAFAVTLPRPVKTGWCMLVCCLWIGLRLAGTALPAGSAFLAVEVIVCCRETASPADALLTLSFFPAVQSGPVRKPSLFTHPAPVPPETLEAGLMRICTGLGRKLLLADNLYPLTAMAGRVTGSLAGSLTALVFTALYIYMDFSGYTDLALGMAQCLGIRLPENFSRPFAAVSVRDFWRRWHISLSAFFRDAIYIPLGGNRKGLFRTCLNTLTVFLATAVWHGLTWPYLFFGLWHALFVCLEQSRLLRPDRLKPLLRHLYTLAVTAFGFLLFAVPDLQSLQRLLCPACLMNPAWRAVWSPLTLLAAVASLLLTVTEGRPYRLPGKRKPLLCGLILILSLLHRLGGAYLPFLYASF